MRRFLGQERRCAFGWAPYHGELFCSHSFGLRFKPWVDYSQTLRAEINRQSKRAVRFDDRSLLNARLAQDKSDAPLVDYLRT
jgi:hypothetical protein